jgi:hypothetical protein
MASAYNPEFSTLVEVCTKPSSGGFVVSGVKAALYRIRQGRVLLTLMNMFRGNSIKRPL